MPLQLKRSPTSGKIEALIVDGQGVLQRKVPLWMVRYTFFALWVPGWIVWMFTFLCFSITYFSEAHWVIRFGAFLVLIALSQILFIKAYATAYYETREIEPHESSPASPPTSP